MSAPTTLQLKCSVDLPFTEVTNTDLLAGKVTNIPVTPLLSPPVSVLDIENSSQANLPALSPQVSDTEFRNFRA